MRIILDENNKEWFVIRDNICERQFENRLDIRRVVIQETVREIGSHAFYECYGLEEVIIGEHLSIGYIL